MIKTICFFMIVTNRDMLIGKYAICSFEKLVIALSGKYSWRLLIYANCLSQENKDILVDLQKKYSFIDVYDNAAHCKPDDFVPGTEVFSDDGGCQIIEGPYENCDTIWSNQFKIFTADYWCAVDADFELLNANIVIDSLELLELNINLVCLSSDMTNTRYNFYESYSNSYCTLFERYNTWFCFYKKSAQACKTSHYYFDEVDPGGQMCKYDSAARFQRDLRYKHKLFCGAMCNQSQKYSKMYVHYGAFSKNKSLSTPEKVRRYRTIVLLAHRGLFFLPAVLNKIVIKICSFALKIYKKEIAERAIYNFKPADTDF